MSLHSYLPQDRLRALARGESLPDRTTGSALFADISGFTALTEGLRESLGARQGAEELSKQLGTVYTALIFEVEKYGGSVIDFAGDSISCWFDDSNGSAAPRAAACAFALQETMKSFASIAIPNGRTTTLTLKVAVASGPARRFMVGDPTINYIDALAGATVSRTSTAEHLATQGDVLVDEYMANVLGDKLSIAEWREDQESKERFAVVLNFANELSELTLPGTMRPPAANKLRVWMHSAVYDREGSGNESFLTEFRPCVALFMRFSGIDYDSDVAEKQLDMFIRQAQSIVERYEGTFLQITIGDKGSYAYINFGALNVHEDDARRAVKTALDLKKAAEGLGFLEPLQMGITQGTLRVGPYGGKTRRTFGALGDEVNLAARLMMNAAVDEILVSGHVHKAVAGDFSFEPREPLAMKGKVEPLPVFAVTGERNQRAIRLQEPTYALPMVGRTEELQIINDKLDLAEQGQGQVIGIIAEAGMGKSRLVAEVIRAARRKGFSGYGGACQSDALNTPYQTWKSVWQAFFGIDPDINLKRQMRNIEGEIEDHAPERLQAMPLLNVVLDLEIPDNDFTKTLEPQYRKSALTALFEDCLRAAAQDEPLLLVIEDMHWIDALSHDLLEELARALTDSPVCFVLAYRPPQLARLEAPRLEAMPNFTKIELHELNAAEAESAIRAKLAQLYPARGGALPSGLVDELMARSQGNPFYLEELLNYVRDRGLDPADLSQIELPDSLHTLILSRIDGLSEHEKTTLRVASIIGRLFRANWLTGYYPELGSFPQVKAALDALSGLDITPLDSPEPELAYLFKHIVTHEVTYESLPFATRARLHEQLARYLESIVGAIRESPLLDTITLHYLRSENKEKQIEYLRKAGEAAQKNFANNAALEYYGQLLPLLMDDKEKTQIHLKRGDVLELMGKWDDAETDYRVALESAKDDFTLKAHAQFALGKLNSLRGDYKPALEWLEKVKEARTKLEDTAGLAQALIVTGMLLSRKGELVQAREPLNEGLSLAREVGDKLNTSGALITLGDLAMAQDDYAEAQELYEKSLALRREIGDMIGIANSLYSLGGVAMMQGDYVTARALGEECLTLQREIGNKGGIANALQFLGNVAHVQGDYAVTRVSYEESLALFREIGAKLEIAFDLLDLGVISFGLRDFMNARLFCEEALVLMREMGRRRGIGASLWRLGFIALEEGNYQSARSFFEDSLSAYQGLDHIDANVAASLLSIGILDLAEKNSEARDHILQSLLLRMEIGNQLEWTSSLIGAAGLVLGEGNPQLAAQLLGAVESALKGLNAVVETEVKFFYERTLAQVKDALGNEAFQSAWEEGSQWLLEEAVKRVLGE